MVKADSADLRRQMLHITPKGRALITRLRPLWRAIAEATEALCEEHAPSILRDLDAVEAALDRSGMLERVHDAAAEIAAQGKVGRKKNASA